MKSLLVLSASLAFAASSAFAELPQYSCRAHVFQSKGHSYTNTKTFELGVIPSQGRKVDLPRNQRLELSIDFSSKDAATYLDLMILAKGNGTSSDQIISRTVAQIPSLQDDREQLIQSIGLGQPNSDVFVYYDVYCSKASD